MSSYGVRQNIHSTYIQYVTVQNDHILILSHLIFIQNV